MLEIAMSRVKAHELLDNPEYNSKLNMDRFYDLLLRAGYPKEEAQRAAKQRGWDRLCLGYDR